MDRRGALNHRRLGAAGVVALVALIGSNAQPATSGATETRSLSTVGIVSADGHDTHPVWQHDTTAAQVGTMLYVAWNTNHAAVEARGFDTTTATWVSDPVQLSVTTLDCQCVDSTGTNPNRHDVPALYADPVGRLYTMYGGGTASKIESGTGPFFRAASNLNSITSWEPEENLSIPGAVYDLEVVRDNQGVNHLVGQQGGNPSGAGSLLYLRFLPGTMSVPGHFDSPEYQTLVQGGSDPSACAWLPTAGCDIFITGRLAAAPATHMSTGTPSPLFLTWGWSEAGLSNTCGDPVGFCNHGLYFAMSLDGGKTWQNAAGTVVTDLRVGPIGYDDPNYQVVPPSMDVSVFKALGVTGGYPGVPMIVYQPGADIGAGSIVVTRFVSGAWSDQTIDSSRPWNNHLVLRTTSTGHVYLWSDIAQSGNYASDLDQWLFSNRTWAKTQLVVGTNWFLTGSPAPGQQEVLMWRADPVGTGTYVGFALVASS